MGSCPDAKVVASSVMPPEILWFGTVTLPEQSINKSLRLAIKEFESYKSENINFGGENSRLVYADFMEI